MHPDHRVAQKGLAQLREQLHAVEALAVGLDVTAQGDVAELLDAATEAEGQLGGLFGAVDGDQSPTAGGLALGAQCIRSVGELVSRSVAAVESMPGEVVSAEAARALNGHLRGICEGAVNVQLGVLAGAAQLLDRAGR